MRTTINIPDELAAQADALIGRDGVTTRNQLIVEALQSWVERKKEKLIDAEFALMAEDPDYTDETLAIEEEFAQSDREVVSLNND